MQNRLFSFILFYVFLGVKCEYLPIGETVRGGNVLLPSSRRGRYLAEIIRRQAVDGTGILFNRDADRMNSEAKKKVDVLSEELLPYIIAEQERRITLYQRVMTAIQNGEKGYTIAELRKKPPVIIRKGLMYRCPINRGPKEPTGSGVIMCEGDIEPTQIMYDSCLSAEDKELYVADNKYFFCNRHRILGPELPRNGTTAFACHPIERTSLEYTRKKCALEDTDDVIVHYRYYPDRTYESVTELDPDREICEHWNPCQIGYIFSLPSRDQATPAYELFHNEKIVPPVPEDTHKVNVKVLTPFETGIKLKIPPGMKYVGIGKYLTGPDGRRHKDLVTLHDTVESKNIEVHVEETNNFEKITINFRPLEPDDMGAYYVEFVDISHPEQPPKLVELIEFEEGTTEFIPQTIEGIPGQRLNKTTINITCLDCTCNDIMVRGEDGSIRNLDSSKFRIHKITDKEATIEIDFDILQPPDFGEYFVDITLVDMSEERLKILTVIDNELGVPELLLSGTVGQPFTKEFDCLCTDCEITDILCNGDSVFHSGQVTVLYKPIPAIDFNFESFEDSNACVYMVVFKKNGTNYYNILTVVEKVIVETPPPVEPPTEGEQFEREVRYKCTRECFIDKVLINGIPLNSNTRKSDMGAIPFFVLGDHKIILRITEFVPMLEGVDQAVFMVDGKPVTKTLLEVSILSMNHNQATTGLNSKAAPVPLACVACSMKHDNHKAPNLSRDTTTQLPRKSTATNKSPATTEAFEVNTIPSGDDGH